MTSDLLGLLFTLESKRRLFFITAVSSIVAMLDVVTILLIFPILLVVVRPSDATIPSPFDSVLGATPDSSTLYTLGGVLFAVVIIKNIAMLFAMRMQTQVAAKMAGRLSRRMLRGYLAAPLSFHFDRKVGNYLRGLRDLPVDICTQGALSYFNRVADIAGGLVMVLGLAVLEPFGIALATAILSLLVLLNRFVLGPRIRAWSTEIAEATRKLYGLVGQTFPAIKVIKTTAAEDSLHQQMSPIFERNARLQAKLRFANMALRPLSEILMLLAAIGLLTAVLWDRDHAIEAVPFLAAFTYAIFRLLPSLTRITSFTNDLKRIAPLVEELNKDLDATEPFLEARARGELGSTIRFDKSLELKNVSYAYPGKTDSVLKDITLTINHGEVIGLAGSSGAGKSTLADVLLGLLEPTSGTLLVDGKPPSREGPTPGSVGYVPQESLLFDASAGSNIAFGAPENAIDKNALANAIEAAQLTETIAGLSGGIDGEIGEGGSKLSGGQRQRFGIARALYREPALLVLDEATSNLDSQTESSISNSINDLRDKTTIVLIAHRLHLLQRCDRIFYLNDGRLEATGSYTELSRNGSGFSQLVQASSDMNEPLATEEKA